MARVQARLGIRELATLSIIMMAMLWGSSYFVLKDLVATIPPVDLLAVRFTIATAALVLVGWRHLRFTRQTIGAGIILGVTYAVAQLMQTIGLLFTTASMSGFITGLYVVFTPFLQAALVKIPVTRRIWIAVILATIGLGILSLQPTGLQFGLGEMLTIICALSYAVNIVATGRYSTSSTALTLTVVQSATITIITWIGALPGGITLPATASGWWALAYLALACGAAAIYLQVWAQAHVDATRAAIIMSSEPLWAWAFAVLSGQEPLVAHAIVGGVMLSAAMILASLPPMRTRRAARGLPEVDEPHGLVDASSAPA